jgi:CDP-diacylglycerol--glycerol-3-phosphate 3-phosphatidyltransferase
MTGRHLPNAITFLRLVLVPIVYLLSFATTPACLWAAGGVFGLAAASDWLDGYLARRLDVRSRLGTLLDPVVDKVLILTVLFVFAERGLWPLWLVLLNMLREFAVSAVRHAATTERRVVGANWMGKTKFCLQTAVVAMGYVALLARAYGADIPAAATVTTAALAVATAASFAFLVPFAWWYHAELPTSADPDEGV